MSNLQEMSEFILKTADSLEKLSADPNGAPRAAIRGTYNQFKGILKQLFNDYLTGPKLTEEEYNAILSGITTVGVKFQASKINNLYKVTIVIVAEPVSQIGTTPAHFSGAVKIGKYLQLKKGKEMSSVASSAASKHVGPNTTSFSVSSPADVLFKVQVTE